MGHKYRLCSSPGRYLTGHLEDGRQVLMGVLCPDYAILYFGSDGTFQHVETRKLTVPPSTREGIYFFDQIANASLDADVAIWTTELRFTESPIEILRFESDAAHIEDLPSALMELEEEPDNFTDDERQELLEWKADWLKSGLYALWWGDELWIDRDGTVNTS